MEKSGHYKLCSWKKADTTNFAHGKKADTTNFSDGKKRTLQNLLMAKSGHYKLL
jgi:hypothetical protein